MILVRCYSFWESINNNAVAINCDLLLQLECMISLMNDMSHTGIHHTGLRHLTFYSPPTIQTGLYQDEILEAMASFYLYASLQLSLLLSMSFVQFLSLGNQTK